MDDTEPRVRLLDLKRQFQEIQPALQEAARSVLDSGWYLLGEKTRQFETQFSAWVGQAHGVACANGTDAITLALLALELKPGSEVITVSNTAFASACGISRAGARPVFADVDPDSWLLDPARIRERVTPRTRAVLAVHLYGHVVRLSEVRSELPQGIEIIEDCAQAHGAELGRKKVGSLSRLSCFSFYPSKNLAAMGDGGMVMAGDEELAEKLRELRFYGQATRDEHSSIGMNSRMDELQAAMLSVELSVLDGWLARRREIAAHYDRILDPTVFSRPVLGHDTSAAYHLYVVRVKDRHGFRGFLDQRGIDTGVHYPMPIHCQPAYRSLGQAKGSLPHTEALCDEITSLPVAPHLTDHEVARVADACQEYAEEVS